MERVLRTLVLAMAFSAVACGDDDRRMTRTDGGPPPDGGARDGGRRDAGTDAGRDAGRDAGTDAGTDAGLLDDAGMDADMDAGIEEMAPDGGPDSPVPVDPWRANAVDLRGMDGTRHDFVCPAGGATGSIYGTDVYTDDSSICTAAVHAGVIDLATGGTVTIEILPGQPAYTSSTRFGITSSMYGSWSGSFAFCPLVCGTACANPRFDEAHCGGCDMPCAAGSACEDRTCFAPCAAGTSRCGGSCITTDTDASNCGGCGVTCAVDEVCSASTCTGFPWSRSATTFRGRDGERFRYTCPAGGSESGVWGTDTYTDDSSVCTAAVHYGLITLAGGGTVTIQIAPGAVAYTGSTRNGITTMDYAAFSGSFIFP